MFDNAREETANNKVSVYGSAKDVIHNVALSESNSLVGAEETQDREQASTHTHTTHTQTHTHTHTHTHRLIPFCASSTLRANRCSSFILNHRRRGKPGELQAASAVRLQPGGSLRKTNPASLWQPAVYRPQQLQQHGYQVSSLQRKWHLTG